MTTCVCCLQVAHNIMLGYGVNRTQHKVSTDEVGNMTLTEFLEARFAEDEAIAWAAVHWNEGVTDWADNEEDDWKHIARWDPARVLAECEAKRRIVQNVCVLMAHRDMYAQDKKYLLCLLALPYADHPDYLPEWRP